jgi:hypothetical protein
MIRILLWSIGILALPIVALLAIWAYDWWDIRRAGGYYQWQIRRAKEGKGFL